MSAFVPPSALTISHWTPRSVPSRSRPSSHRARVRNQAPRAKPLLLRATASDKGNEQSAADADADDADAVDDGLPDVKEPYPGYFADMRRMGLTDEQAYAQALKMQKQSSPVKSDRVGGRKNLFREDGSAYAPWMGDLPNAVESRQIKRTTDATGRLAADPQQGELSGIGMTWRMLGDELELSWNTGAEEDNMGFAISRRRGKESEWLKIADYRDQPSLVSKGSKGGSYSFLVQDAEPGTWVYRVSDVDVDKNVADLSQVLVEIESPQDSLVQKIALAALLGVLLLAGLAGLYLDPLQSA